MTKFIPGLLLALVLAACSSLPQSHSVEKEDDVISGNTLIESPIIWEAIQKGIENSPEIKYARRISGQIENSFQAEVSQLPAVNQPSAKCSKLPAIDVVMNAEGKVTRSANRAKSCWLSGTRTALNVLQTLKFAAPPPGLLKDGKFKFSWTPEIPEGKAE